MMDQARANPARWWKTRSRVHVHHSPGAMFVGRTRRLLTAALLLALVSVLAGIWYLTNSRRLTAMSETFLSSALGTPVHIGSVHLSMAGSLRLSAVALKTGANGGRLHVLFSARALIVRFTWLSLLTGQLHVTRFTAIDPVVNLVDDEDSHHWNYQSLASQRRHGSHGHALNLPVIVLQGMRLRWAHIHDGHYHQGRAMIMDGRLVPDALGGDNYDFKITQRRRSGRRGAALTGNWNVISQQIHATLSHAVVNSALWQTLPAAAQRVMKRLRVKGLVRAARLALRPDGAADVRLEFDNGSMFLPIKSRFNADANVPFRHLAGEILVNQRGVRAVDLSGTVFGHAFAIPHAAYDGFNAAAPFDFSMNMPAQMLSRHYPAAFFTHTLDIGRQVLERVLPTGRVSLNVRVRRAASGGQPRVRGTVRCLDMQARYAHFPYPLRRVKGTIRFSNHHIRFADVTGVAGRANIVINGDVGIGHHDSPVNLTITCPGGKFDKRLAACLPGGVLKMWKLFNPHGRAGFVCRVTRPAGKGGLPRIVVAVNSQDMSGSYVGFPYPVRHATGKLRLSEHSATVDLRGELGHTSGVVSLIGKAAYPSGNLHRLAVRIAVHAVRQELDANLRGAVPARYRLWLNRFDPHGAVTFNGHFTKSFGGQPVVTGKVTMAHGMLTPKSIPWPLRDVSMNATMFANELKINRFDALAGSGRQGHVSVVGTVRGRGGARILRAKGSWTLVRVGDQMPRGLPGPLQKKVTALWSEWRPAGLSSGDFSLDCVLPGQLRIGAGAAGAGTAAGAPGAAGKKNSPKVVALAAADAPKSRGSALLKHMLVHVHLLDARLRPRFAHAAVRHIVGLLTLTGRQAQWKSLRGLVDAAVLTSQGSLLWKGKRLDAAMSFASKTLPTKLLSRLSPAMTRILKSLAPQARCVVRLTRVDGSFGHALKFTGGLLLSQLATKGPLAAKIHSLRVSGVGTFLPATKAVTFKGDVSGKNIRVLRRGMRSLHATLMVNSASHFASLTHILGHVAGGQLTGRLRMAYPGTPGYDGAFVLTGARVQDVALPSNATPAARKELGTGSVTANIHVLGQWGTKVGRKAGGSVVVQNARLYNVPFAMGLMQVATFRLPISAAFRSARMRYRLRGNQVTMNKIVLESPGINLKGSGTFNLRTQMVDLRLFTGTPKGFTIPLLSPMLNFARNAMLGLHISGSIKHPKVLPLPLSGLRAGM